jgi:hypothetical protein
MGSLPIEHWLIIMWSLSRSLLRFTALSDVRVRADVAAAPLRRSPAAARSPRPLGPCAALSRPARDCARNCRCERVEDKRQGPPKLHDLPSLQKLCGSRFGWPASKKLEVAQELYDGQGKKITTYPRAEVRYLPQSLISDVPRIVAGLRVGQSFSTIPVPNPPITAGVRAALSTARTWRARDITLSFPTSTRSTNCGSYGLACRPMRKNCLTSSREPIWPP